MNAPLLTFNSAREVPAGQTIRQVIGWNHGEPFVYQPWTVTRIERNYIDLQNGNRHIRFFRSEFPLWGWTR